MEKQVSNLQKLIDVNLPIIYIDDYNYVRVDDLIRRALGSNVKIKEWNPASRNTNFENKEPYPAEASLSEFLREQYGADRGNLPTQFLLLRDISDLINDNEIISLLCHIAQRKLYDAHYDTTVIISDYGLNFPQKLLPYVSIVSLDIPDDEEIDRLITDHLEVNEFDVKNFTKEDREAIMPSLKGLTAFEIDRVLDMAISRNGSLGDEDKEMILQQKKSQVKKSGLLDLIEVTEKPDDIGGLEKLKKYLSGKSHIMNNLEEARKNYISTPKGVFIVGMPGCGKSLCAKAAASLFGCPLLKLDMGSMMGKYVGQSESNLRRAIKIAEAAAPCILWIDEIEKGFSGVGGNNDIMTRMFGYFLSWMQDKKTSVYVIATANNADNLPPELKRKGRFDEIFCVNLPTPKEREAILKVHLAKRKQQIPKLDRIIKATTGFNGADIESVINEALEAKFLNCLSQASNIKIKLTEDDLLATAKETVSISKSCKAQIEKMKKIFSESNFTNASTADFHFS